MLHFALAAASSGMLITSAYCQTQTPAPRSGPAPAPSSQEVGVVNGLTLWGNDVIVARNGVTEKLGTALQLRNGMVVEASGAMTTRNGQRTTLRPGQVITFEGQLLIVPIRPGQPPTTSISPHQDTASATMTKQAVEDAAKMEDQRRSNNDAKIPTKAGQSSQP